MNRLLHIALLSLMLATFLASCGDDSCYDNGSSLPLATFYLGGNQQQVSGMTIMGMGAPGDSLLADSSTLKEIYLPLRASVGSTSFAITRWIAVGAAVRDTLTFSYDAVPFFHSSECGAMYNFNIKQLDYTHHGIDSIVMLKTTITNDKSPSLRIYLTSLQP